MCWLPLFWLCDFTLHAVDQNNTSHSACYFAQTRHSECSVMPYLTGCGAELCMVLVGFISATAKFAEVSTWSFLFFSWSIRAAAVLDRLDFLHIIKPSFNLNSGNAWGVSTAWLALWGVLKAQASWSLQGDLYASSPCSYSAAKTGSDHENVSSWVGHA